MKSLAFSALGVTALLALGPGCGQETESETKHVPTAAPGTSASPTPTDGDATADGGGADNGTTDGTDGTPDGTGDGGTDGTTTTGPVDDRSGTVTQITSAGKVYGWAVNKQDLKTKVAVKLYLDGPMGTGTLAASTTADRSGADGNHEGNHAFFVQVPTSFATGVKRPLYLYGNDVLLTTTPVDFKAWGPTQRGRDFFAATVQPKLTVCLECHSPTYDGFFASMLGKGPNEGGTATNNGLYNKPATNGVSHGGGNRCGSTTSPCVEFAAWWKVEFE